MLSVAAGALAATQTVVLGRFGHRIGALPAMAFTAIMASVISLALLPVLGQDPGRLLSGFHAPAWMWIGGLLGPVYLLLVDNVGPPPWHDNDYRVRDCRAVNDWDLDRSVRHVRSGTNHN